MRSSALLSMALMVLLATPATGTEPHRPPEPSCAEGIAIRLELVTPEGTIAIELDPAAAPRAVVMVEELARGPVFDSGQPAADPSTSGIGYYTGLELDYALPGAELATAIRPPVSAFRIPLEIDADALGLDQRTLTTRREAMRVWQQEILPYEGSGNENPVLSAWMSSWRETMEPDFLIGASQKDVNLALGYHYLSGLPSLPVRRGAVALRSSGKAWASPALSIILRDRPELDGRRMVVGHVTDGLDFADSLSRRQLTPAKRQRHRPLDPVRIIGSRIHCATDDGQRETAPKE